MPPISPIVFERFIRQPHFQQIESWVTFLAPRAADDNELVAVKVLSKYLEIFCFCVAAWQPVSNIVGDVFHPKLGASAKQWHDEGHDDEDRDSNIATDRKFSREEWFDHDSVVPA